MVFLLFLGDLGGGELLLLIGLFLALLVVVLRLFRRSKPTVVINQTTGSGSVADELRKLEELRDRGVLTQAEFEMQKMRLLQ